jgi:DNA repair photolyase
MATPVRWRTSDDDNPQGALFDADALLDRHVGRGEFRGLEFLHVNARRIINEVPAASRMPFRYTINAYRGCSHSCVYCQAGDTPILMANGRTKPLANLRVGDMVYGTVRQGSYRRYMPTPVVAHWQTMKPAYRITLEDGTELLASGDHRYLSDRGWKYVSGAMAGPGQRPYLTANNKLMGTGRYATPPEHNAGYRQGYLCGMIRGDGHLGSYVYARPGRSESVLHRFRLALVDFEGLERTRTYLDAIGVTTTEFQFAAATATHRESRAIRTQTRDGVGAIRRELEWPDDPSDDWCKGFLAGIFDAEGSFSGSLRITNKDERIINEIAACLLRFGFAFVIEGPTRNGCLIVRLLHGLREILRFFHTVDPAITRKRTIDGVALKSDAKLRVTSVEALGIEMPMYDITTGTGDFIANGVVSHNCFARPTHEYLGLDIGKDFDSKIVVKVNAVERLRAELAPKRWGGHHIAMGTNTDPYQRAEGKYHLTRGIIEVLAEAANPFSILTKSTLILRDLDLLVAAAERTGVHTSFSIGTLDEEVWKLTEPGTPHPRQRVEAVARLNAAGIPCGVLIAPIIPGLSDRPEQVEAVRAACRKAGAPSAPVIKLHLRKGVKEHFMGWLEASRPDLVPAYEQLYSRGAYQREPATGHPAPGRGSTSRQKGRNRA